MNIAELPVEIMNDPPSYSQITRTRLTLFARELTRAVQRYKDEQKNKAETQTTVYKNT